MKVVWNGKVIAEADKDKLIYIKGNWYSPPESVPEDLLRKSDMLYTCPWKSVCQYFDVGESDTWSKDNAWSRPRPKESSIDIVKKDFANYVAFWRDVQVTE